MIRRIKVALKGSGRVLFDGPVRPWPVEIVTGRCICCKGWFKVRRDGNVRVHGLMHGALCLGSDRPPEVDLW